MAVIKVQATWDEEAGVWVAESDDVPGLITEAPTVETLLTKLDTLIPELIAENGGAPGAAIPFDIVCRTHRVTHAAE